MFFPSRPTSRTLSITLNKHTTYRTLLWWWRGESDSKRHDISARIQFRTHLFVMRGENPFCQSAQAPPAAEAASVYILCCCRRWALCPENCHLNNKTTPSFLLHIFTAQMHTRISKKGFGTLSVCFEVGFIRFRAITKIFHWISDLHGAQGMYHSGARSSPTEFSRPDGGTDGDWMISVRCWEKLLPRDEERMLLSDGGRPCSLRMREIKDDSLKLLCTCLPWWDWTPLDCLCLARMLRMLW